MPESGISSLPKIVRFILRNPAHQKISIKKDRNFLFFTEIPLGTTVVLEHPDTSRFARLNKKTKADGASKFEPLYLLKELEFR
ncbi:MAG TPA: hypothetical protein VFS90_07055 [Pyrinomonadaceae bacterium]|nr:hypothetical protein [Pyrinomonadaceae bacterium]